MSIVLFAAAPTQPAHATTSFTVFDNTDYQNVAIAGAAKANYIPNKKCQEMYALGKENDEAYWKNLVSTWIAPDSDLGVLDCEDLHLRDPATANFHYQEMLRLQGWAREVYPTMQLGWYDLSRRLIEPGQYSYYRDLLAADGNQAFLPSLYNVNETRHEWNQKAQDALAEANIIGSDIPVYAYVWPQYHGTSATPFEWIDPGRWSVQLSTLVDDGGFDGAVVWGGQPISGTCDATCQSEAATQGWLTKTEATISWNAQGLTDLALNKTATASSSHPDRPPANAIDGDPYTSWNSEVDNPEHITVDLGATYSIDHGVRIVWRIGHSTSYKIEFSTNGTSWTQVYSCSCGDEGQRYHPGADGSARYVRITGTARSYPQWAHAMWSLNVYD